MSKIVEVVSRGVWSPRLTSADPLAPVLKLTALTLRPEALTHRRKVSVSINRFPQPKNFRPVAPRARSQVSLTTTRLHIDRLIFRVCDLDFVYRTDTEKN